MDARIWFVGLWLLMAGSAVAIGGQEPDYRTAAAASCPQDAVDAHVREQLASYGPLSNDREYFGFIFLFEGEIGSAITRGHYCRNLDSCAVNTALAAPRIPKGAKVLGEWHTHPRLSSAATLSADDVRGAQNNRHIRCYAAYYSQPDGDIYAWNPFQTSVPTAMSSLVLIGNYWRTARDHTHPDSNLIAMRLPADQPPGEQDEHEKEPDVRNADLR